MDSEDRINPQHAVIGVFILGLIVGFSAGVVSPYSTDSSSEPGLVELNNPEYPYEGVQAGIGEENINNHTLQGEPYLGSQEAEVTMVAYEEFQCPFCKQYNEDAFPMIMDEYVSEGEVRYYMKAFLIGHPWAVKGHVASECALNQDAEAYWSYKKGFFSNQEALNNLYEKNTTKFDESMVRWAEQTELDVDSFRQCYDNQETRQEVMSDFNEGKSTGVSGTPTIFVEDRKMVGAQPFSRFQANIESELQE